MCEKLDAYLLDELLTQEREKKSRELLQAEGDAKEKEKEGVLESPVVA